MKTLKMLVLKLWLRLCRVEHDLIRKEHVLAAKARVAVHDLTERPLTRHEMELIEII